MWYSENAAKVRELRAHYEDNRLRQQAISVENAASATLVHDIDAYGKQLTRADKAHTGNGRKRMPHNPGPVVVETATKIIAQDMAKENAKPMDNSIEIGFTTAAGTRVGASGASLKRAAERLGESPEAPQSKVLRSMENICAQQDDDGAFSRFADEIDALVEKKRLQVMKQVGFFLYTN